MEGKYDDIIDLPHPTSLRHPPMKMIDRAAQFSPFSALAGYEDAIAESGRLTREEGTAEQDEKEILDRKLRYLHDHPGQQVIITYFSPDNRKSGGEYLQTEGIVKKIDPLNQLLVTENRSIPMESIRDLQIADYDI